MNFIDEYYEYSRDGFVPDKFYYWAGISAVAAALERKVFIKAKKFTIYPNMYLLLVGQPGDGKSTALSAARNLLSKINENPVRIFPEQITQAKFVEMLSKGQGFEVAGKVIPQSTAYLSFSEASNSALSNIHGDFIATLTDFYDCPKSWSRATISRGQNELSNICINLFAGCTFSYLRELINSTNITGGFASRVMYVAQTENFEREVSFESSFMEREATKDELAKQKALVERLEEIHKLKGSFSFTEEMKHAWADWFNKNDKERRELKSEVMQSILARKNTNALKLCMILSAAESDKMVITLDHWEKALELTADLESVIVDMFSKARSIHVETQEGINNVIYRALKDTNLTEDELTKALMSAKAKPVEIEATIKAMIKSKMLARDKTNRLELRVNPIDQL